MHILAAKQLEMNKKADKEAPSRALMEHMFLKAAGSPKPYVPPPPVPDDAKHPQVRVPNHMPKHVQHARSGEEILKTYNHFVGALDYSGAGIAIKSQGLSKTPM